MGDSCVYMEVDSFLPVTEQFEFLRKSSYKKNELLGEGFRLKTQRFKGQISQGLVQPLTILPDGEYQLGDDVTELLGIRKWEIEERVTNSGTVIGEFPAGISKTDELRVQSYPQLMDGFQQIRGYYISTKLDGTSVTMYWKDGKFGVCGRNYEFADDEKCAMWKYAHKKKLPERFKESGIGNIAIQGEFCGAGIQKNRLKLLQPEWFVFTVINLDTKERYPLFQMQRLCEILALKTVPIEEIETDFKYNTVEELLERARGKYEAGGPKEGIVVANYAYLDTGVNISIGMKAPNVYFTAAKEQCSTGEINVGTITNIDAFNTNLEVNCIPSEIINMTAVDYPDFLQKRRVLMAKKIKEYYNSL